MRGERQRYIKIKGKGREKERSAGRTLTLKNNRIFLWGDSSLYTALDYGDANAGFRSQRRAAAAVVRQI